MQKALAQDISTWPEENPQLIGSECGACSATVFPRQSHCPKCSKAEMSDVLLPRRGTVIAWTTQGFPPGAPHIGPTGKDFVPFGMEVELIMLPFAVDASDPENPVEIVTFAFQPV